MGIDAFIKQASGELDIGQDTARDATGRLLGLIKDNADAGDFAELTSQLPGVKALAAAAPAAAGGGGLGGMIGGLGSALGGSGGGAAGALGALAASGLGMQKIGSFVGLFSGFLKKQVSGALTKRLLGSVPGLSDLLG